jgi:spermidine/putrescine transport system permease protein
MNREQQDKLFKRSTISVVSLWITFFGILPLSLVFICSFLKNTPDALYTWKATLENYDTLFQWNYFIVFVRSFKLAIIVTSACLIIGYPFAYFLSRVPQHIKRWLALFVIIPFWTSSLLRSYAIISLIDAHGFVNNALLKFHIIHAPLQMLYTNFAVWLGLIYNLMPFVVLPLLANMEKLDRRLIDAARDLGANGYTILTKILFPLTRSGIYAAVLLSFLPAMTLFYIPDLLGGAKSLLLGNLIQLQFLEARNWPLGAAVSLTLTAFMGILLLFYFRSERQRKKW